MLLVTATFDLSRISLLLLASLLGQKSSLSSVNLDTMYSSPYKQAGSVFVSPVLADITFQSAEVACTGLSAELFSVSKDMDVKTLMEEQGLTAIWTGIYKSARTQTLVDKGKVPPVTKTKFGNISMEELSTVGFDDSKAVILQLRNDKLYYSVVSKTDTYKALCTTDIPFPRKIKDLNSVKKVQKNMIKEISTLTDAVKVTFGILEKQLILLPRVDDTEGSGTPISDAALQTALESKIEELQALSNRTVEILSNLHSPLDVCELLTEQQNLIALVKYVEKVCTNVIEEPITLIEKQYLERIGPDSTTTLVLRGTGSDKLLVTLESKDDRDRIQENRGVAGNVNPNIEISTTSAPTPDPTTVSTTLPTTVSSSTSTIQTTESLTTTISTTAPTTTPQSTTSTPVTTTTTNNTTSVRSDLTFDTENTESWSNWFNRSLQNLKGFAHWLGFSLYFLTLYDIAFGTLTTLNSIYILYKICSKYPDNRPPGQTRLRVALTRLFGRKKEVVKKTQANEEIPMQFMNMPSPSAPEMPQVRMISTPKPPRSRTPIRRIHIEE
jgi:hypothetical protein